MKVLEFFKKIFTSRSRGKAQEGEWEKLVTARGGVDFEQEEERTRYVTDCLEQIAEASQELEMLQGEYSRVTAYLTDLEELEALPDQEKETLEITARKLQNMEREYESFTQRKNRMDDAIYYQMKNRCTGTTYLRNAGKGGTGGGKCGKGPILGGFAAGRPRNRGGMSQLF